MSISLLRLVDKMQKKKYILKKILAEEQKVLLLKL